MARSPEVTPTPISPLILPHPPFTVHSPVSDSDRPLGCVSLSEVYHPSGFVLICCVRNVIMSIQCSYWFTYDVYYFVFVLIRVWSRVVNCWRNSPSRIKPRPTTYLGTCFVSALTSWSFGASVFVASSIGSLFEAFYNKVFTNSGLFFQ